MSHKGRAGKKMVPDETRWDEEKFQHRYVRVAKIFFLLTVIYLLWIALVLIGTYFLRLGNNWAGLTVEQWILTAIFLVSVVIGLEIVLLLYYMVSKKRLSEPEPEQAQFIQGRRVHSYTVPLDAKGGIFSKTYIVINDDSILNVRYQMILPGELWGQHQ
jgi:hypothetical protein